METFGGLEVWLLSLLTSTLDGGEWSDSRPGSFTPGKYLPGYRLNKSLGGSQNRCGRGGEEKDSLPLPGIEPRSSIP